MWKDINGGTGKGQNCMLRKLPSSAALPLCFHCGWYPWNYNALYVEWFWLNLQKSRSRGISICGHTCCMWHASKSAKASALHDLSYTRLPTHHEILSVRVLQRSAGIDPSWPACGLWLFMHGCVVFQRWTHVCWVLQSIISGHEHIHIYIYTYEKKEREQDRQCKHAADTHIYLYIARIRMCIYIYIYVYVVVPVCVRLYMDMCAPIRI